MAPFFASDWGLGGGFSLRKPDWDAGLSFNGPVWSISVEVLAYAVFWILARKGPFTALRLCKIMAVLIIAKMTLPWIKDIPSCQIYFFIGGAVYLLITQGWAVNRLVHATGMAVLLAATAVLGNTLTEGKIHTITLILVTAALLLSFLALGKIIKSPRVSGCFCSLGNLTYSSYMIHFPLQIFVILALERLGINPEIYSHWATAVGFLLFLFLLSHASYVFFEHPVQNWLRSRLGRTMAPHPTGPDSSRAIAP
ncbi:acyltransferase family protein [Magnetospirillum fulvum]|uniref:acyltransferase family protein n=1 Tax=Magnetospirillum fulvum TaxID=1082 RepID=UPI002F2B7E7C